MGEPMTVTPLPFWERTSFRDVRDRMQVGHGMFAGSDRDLPSLTTCPGRAAPEEMNG